MRGKNPFPSPSDVIPKRKRAAEYTQEKMGHLIQQWNPDPGWTQLPDNREQFLLHSKDGQVLPLLQNRLLLCEFTAGFALFLHVVCKLLLCPENTQQPKRPARLPTSSLLTGLLPCFLHPEVSTASNMQEIFETPQLPGAAHLLCPKGPDCCLRIHRPKPAQRPQDTQLQRAQRSYRSASGKSSALKDFSQKRS